MKKKDRKNKGIKKTALNMFILICFAAGAFLLYQSVLAKIDEKRTNETYSEIEAIYEENLAEYENETSEDSKPTPSLETTTTITPEPTSAPTATPSPTPSPTPTTAPTKETVETDKDLIPQRIPVDRADVLNYFNDLLDVNEDIRGYIKIPGTNISYPVVQGIDNEFYLERNIYGKKTISASIFIDYRNDARKLDDNTIIYGHNLNTTMFNDLDYYVDEKTRDEYYKNGPVFRFDTLYKVMEWEIYSAYIVDKDDFNYLITNFRNDEQHQEFLDETMERSFLETGITVTVDDVILTLSTCNHWYNDSRTVIHARLVTK
jgi:sortase B